MQAAALGRRRICRTVLDRGIIAERQVKERVASVATNLQSKFSKTCATMILSAADA